MEPDSSCEIEIGRVFVDGTPSESPFSAPLAAEAGGLGADWAVWLAATEGAFVLNQEDMAVLGPTETRLEGDC